MKTPQPTYASLLDEIDPQGKPALGSLARQALVPVAVVLGLLALWVFVAPLSGAVIANGKLKVELNRKTVQHQEGGIVRQILVRDGELVRAGQPLLVVGDVRNDAELSLLQDQLDAERIRNARASAEATFSTTFAAPDTISVEPSASSAAHSAVAAQPVSAGTAEHLTREKALFDSRRRTLDEQVSSLNAQIRDAQGQADALSKQIAATNLSAKLASEELALNEKLVREGFVQKARLLQLRRDESDYRGRLSESQSDLAVARQHAGELQARIAQARNQYQQQATDETKESAGRMRELEERLRPSRDQVDRQYVRAPVDGKVMGLRVSAIGEVVGPRDPLLDIVPTGEKLVVEAHIRPQDINSVREGSAADVRLTSFDSRTTPLLHGSVVFVSPDLISAQDGSSTWFVATVEVDARALAKKTNVTLQAGMPAELFVTTPARSLFAYLAKPFTTFTSRALREP